MSVTETLKTTSTDSWSAAQAGALVVVCLVAGTAGGWLIRKSTPASATPQAVASSAPSQVASAPPPGFGMENSGPSPEQLKAAADSQAAPLLEKLKANPSDAGLLANVGNIYYDAKQYKTAIEYYEHSLKVQPADTSVRTDLGTAYWYTGDADTAISEFNKALTYDPNKADTLFNLGIVKWQGKKDGPGAVAAWQKLLATNPSYPQKDTVEQLMAQAQQK